MRSQYENKQKMIPKSYTHEDVRVLVEEFLANGGTITQCPSGRANVRSKNVRQLGVENDLRSKKVLQPRKRFLIKRTIAPSILALPHKKAA